MQRENLWHNPNEEPVQMEKAALLQLLQPDVGHCQHCSTSLGDELTAPSECAEVTPWHYVGTKSSHVRHLAAADFRHQTRGRSWRRHKVWVGER